MEKPNWHMLVLVSWPWVASGWEGRGFCKLRGLGQMTSPQFPDASPNHVRPCFSSLFCGWLPCAMNAFLKAFKQEQFFLGGGELKGGSVAPVSGYGGSGEG